MVIRRSGLGSSDGIAVIRLTAGFGEDGPASSQISAQTLPMARDLGMLVQTVRDISRGDFEGAGVSLRLSAADGAQGRSFAALADITWRTP